MGTTDEAWNEVGEQFKSLGSSLKRLYESAAESKPEEPPSDAELKEALRTIGDGITHAFSAISDAASDPDIRQETRQTASSFFEALGTTFSEVGEGIINRDDASPEDFEPPTEAATGEDADEA